MDMDMDMHMHMHMYMYMFPTCHLWSPAMHLGVPPVTFRLRSCAPLMISRMRPYM